MDEEVQRDAPAATWRVALRPVRLLMYLPRPVARLRPGVARCESGGKNGGNSKPDAAGAQSGSAAHARDRGNAAAGSFIRVAPGGSMKSRSALPLTAAGATALLAIAACSGSKPGAPGSSGGYNAAVSAVVNPSSHKGGTIVFDDSTVPDSTDPGNTYHAEIWNLLRFYGHGHLHAMQLSYGPSGPMAVPSGVVRTR